MARRSLIAASLFAAAFLAVPDGHAAGKAKAPGAKESAAAPKSDGKWSGKEGKTVSENPELLKSLAKVRAGSVLRRNKPLFEPIDLRGDYERRRDLEVVRHYTRLAELDAIQGLARKANDLRLLDRVEEVRRDETERFWSAMQQLRAAARERLLLGNR